MKKWNGVLVLLLVGAQGGIIGDDWPGFRGSTGNGVSAETGLPSEWSLQRNLAWTLDLPGRGNSSPAIVGDRLYLTTKEDDHTLRVLAVDPKSGRILWNVAVGNGEMPTQGPRSLYAHRHNAATPSPAADPKRVYAYFGNGLMVCLDRDGKERWRIDLVKRYGAYNVRFGMAASPRVWDDRLYHICLHKGPSYVLALNAQSGSVAWKRDRKFAAEYDGPDAYSSPVIFTTPKGPRLLVAGSDHVNAYDLSNGEQVWYSGGLTIDSHYGRVLVSPAVADDVVVVCSANPPDAVGLALALRTDGTGDVTDSHRLWRFTSGTPDAPTPVCYRDRVYMVRDDGVATILELRTGQLIWQDRLGNGTFRAATVAGDGKVYFLSKEGECVVMQAGSKGRILARNQLPGTFFATPAICEGSLFLRGHGKLYSISSRKTARTTSGN